MHLGGCNFKKTSFAFSLDLEIQSAQLTSAILENKTKQNIFLRGKVATSRILCGSSSWISSLGLANSLVSSCSGSEWSHRMLCRAAEAWGYHLCGTGFFQLASLCKFHNKPSALSHPFMGRDFLACLCACAVLTTSEEAAWRFR